MQDYREPGDFDLREALNAVSDVIQNRPRPLRDFDQIYMKAGDMLSQCRFVAQWAHGKRLAFMGDGDAIGVCVAYLHRRGLTQYSPSRITVFDFDERIVMAVKRFADAERLDNLDAVLYNCFDAAPQVGKYDCFYTNPPWGASNSGESVNLFVQRGMEFVGNVGEGLVVIADDEELDWPKSVLASVQSFAARRGFFVSRMMPRLHRYHLDDAPELRSCNLMLSSLPGNARTVASEAITDPHLLQNFYGRSKQPRVRYIRERKRLDYGKASEEEYHLDLLEGGL